MESAKEDNGYKTFQNEDASLSDSEHDGSLEAADKTSLISSPVVFQICVILGLLVCILCGAFSSAAVQVLDGVLPEFELNAWRFGIQWVLMIPIVLCKGSKLIVPLKHVPILGLSIFLINTLNVFMYTTYIYIPLGLADALMNSVVLAGNAVLSICIKSDRKLTLYIGAVICIIGLVLMMQPAYLFSGADLPPHPVTNWTSPCKENVTTSHSNIIGDSVSMTSNTLGYVYALITSVILIASFHSIGKMVEDLDPFTFAFWNAALGTTVSTVLMLIFEEPTLLASVYCWALLVIHGVGTTALEVSRPWSLQYIRPSVCAMIHSSKMPMMVALQYTILSNIKPGFQNWVEILGAIICFCGMLGGPLTEIIKTQAQQ